MMQCEFEELVGHRVDEDLYYKIDACYMCMDAVFPTKNVVVDYYNRVGATFFSNLYKEIEDKGWM